MMYLLTQTPFGIKNIVPYFYAGENKEMIFLTEAIAAKTSLIHIKYNLLVH